MPHSLPRVHVSDEDWEWAILHAKLASGTPDPRLDEAKLIDESTSILGANAVEVRRLAGWFDRYADRVGERADLADLLAEAHALAFAPGLVTDMESELARNERELRTLDARATGCTGRVERYLLAWLRWVGASAPLAAAQGGPDRARALRARREAVNARSLVGRMRLEHPRGAPLNVGMRSLAEFAIERGIGATEVQRRAAASGWKVTREAVQQAINRVRASARAVRNKRRSRRR